MKKHRLLIVIFGVLCLQFQIFAAENSSPNAELNRLIAAGQYQAALELSEENLEEWEGDPEFDFFYGLAALESGRANDSVFAFERVAATSPDGLLRERSKLELARAYFVTNNLSASENLFNQVLLADPPPPANVQQNIEAFLLLIIVRRESQIASASWTISSAIGSDDNINAATSESLIDTPLIGQIELDPDGQETEDEYSHTVIAMDYKYPFTRDRSLDVHVNLTHLDNFNINQFDIDSLRGRLSYNWGSENNRFSHGMSATKVNLDNNGFQDSASIDTSWQHAGNNGWYQTLAASFRQIRYDTGNDGENNDLRDVDQILVTGGLTKLMGGFTHSVNLYYADEDPEHPNEGLHNGREFAGLAYSMLYRYDAQHTPYLRMSYQEVEHDDYHPVFFNTIRKDHNQSYTVGWFFQYHRKLMITGEVTFTDNKSNIELFDYDRFRFQAGFRYQF